MKTVQTILHQLTDGDQILRQLRETLTQIDPQFPVEEAKYQAAAAALRQVCGSEAEAYLAARGALYAAAVIYIGWQGVQLNMDTFHHPVHSLLLHGDFEHLCQEEKVATLPAYAQAQKTICAFHEAAKDQPCQVEELLSEISNYYAHLETVGYKVAHFFGYRLADELLCHLVPGYVSDPGNTEHYRLTLCEYLQIDLNQLG